MLFSVISFSLFASSPVISEIDTIKPSDTQKFRYGLILYGTYSAGGSDLMNGYGAYYFRNGNCFKGGMFLEGSLFSFFNKKEVLNTVFIEAGAYYESSRIVNSFAHSEKIYFQYVSPSVALKYQWHKLSSNTFCYFFQIGYDYKILNKFAPVGSLSTLGFYDECVNNIVHSISMELGIGSHHWGYSLYYDMGISNVFNREALAYYTREGYGNSRKGQIGIKIFFKILNNSF